MNMTWYLRLFEFLRTTAEKIVDRGTTQAPTLTVVRRHRETAAKEGCRISVGSCKRVSGENFLTL